MLGERFDIVNVASCYGHLLGVIILFSILVNHFTGRHIDAELGTADYVQLARARAKARQAAWNASGQTMRAAFVSYMANMVRTDLFWIMVASFYAAFTLLGPVGTYETLVLAERAGLFAMVFAVILLLGAPAIVWLALLLVERGWNQTLATSATAALACLFMALPLYAMVTSATGQPLEASGLFINYLIYTPVLMLCANLSNEIVALAARRANSGDAVPRLRQAAEAAAPSAMAPLESAIFVHGGPDSPPRAPILDLLPAERRGHLVSLNAEDHYVRITTANGDVLHRMRMRDAVAMTAPMQGIRVHRSSWIALCAIQRLEREGRASIAVLVNGQRVRLSRAGVKLYREMTGD
jgi:DNA-binding LytR/AlgR family response regulator